MITIHRSEPCLPKLYCLKYRHRSKTEATFCFGNVKVVVVPFTSKIHGDNITKFDTATLNQKHLDLT